MSKEVDRYYTSEATRAMAEEIAALRAEVKRLKNELSVEKAMNAGYAACFESMPFKPVCAGCGVGNGDKHKDDCRYLAADRLAEALREIRGLVHEEACDGSEPECVGCIVERALAREKLYTDPNRKEEHQTGRSLLMAYEARQRAELTWLHKHNLSDEKYHRGPFCEEPDECPQRESFTGLIKRLMEWEG